MTFIVYSAVSNSLLKGFAWSEKIACPSVQRTSPTVLLTTTCTNIAQSSETHCCSWLRVVKSPLTKPKISKIELPTIERAFCRACKRAPLAASISNGRRWVISTTSILLEIFRRLCLDAAPLGCEVISPCTVLPCNICNINSLVLSRHAFTFRQRC